MKRSRIILLIVLLVVVPATLYVSTRLPGRSYYLMSAVVAIEILVPFFAAYEKRRPQPRELVTVAVLAALAVIARVAIPIPNFKPTFAVIMLAGIAFGPETGFIVGALGALGSDFFYGQGPFTPWQMMAYGTAGILAGVAFARGRLPRKNWVMGLFCFLCTVIIVGPLLDTSTVFLTLSKVTWTGALALYLSGLWVNLTHGAACFVFLLLFGNVLLEKLERVKNRYGMMESDEDEDGV